jgi:hypothetical protein
MLTTFVLSLAAIAVMLALRIIEISSGRPFVLYPAMRRLERPAEALAKESKRLAHAVGKEHIGGMVRKARMSVHCYVNEMRSVLVRKAMDFLRRIEGRHVSSKESASSLLDVSGYKEKTYRRRSVSVRR